MYSGSLGWGLHAWSVKAQHHASCMCVLCGGGESSGPIREVYNINYSITTNCHAQIAGTEAEPQQIVAQRLLSCLQYPVP